MDYTAFVAEVLEPGVWGHTLAFLTSFFGGSSTATLIAVLIGIALVFVGALALMSADNEEGVRVFKPLVWPALACLVLAPVFYTAALRVGKINTDSYPSVHQVAVFADECGSPDQLRLADGATLDNTGTVEVVCTQGQRKVLGQKTQVVQSRPLPEAAVLRFDQLLREHGQVALSSEKLQKQ